MSMKESMYGVMAGNSSTFGTCMEQVQMSELNSLKQQQQQSNNRNGSNLVYDKSLGLGGTAMSNNGTLSTPKEYLYFPSSCEGLEAVNSNGTNVMVGAGTTAAIQSLQQRSGPSSSSVEQLLDEEPEDMNDTIQYIPPSQLNTASGHHHHSHVHHVVHGTTSSSQQPGQFRVSNATSATPTTSNNGTRERTYEVPFVLTKVCYSLDPCSATILSLFFRKKCPN